MSTIGNYLTQIDNKLTHFKDFSKMPFTEQTHIHKSPRQKGQVIIRIESQWKFYMEQDKSTTYCINIIIFLNENLKIGTP